MLKYLGVIVMVLCYRRLHRCYVCQFISFSNSLSVIFSEMCEVAVQVLGRFTFVFETVIMITVTV
jgi:hypothetical protein